MRISKSQIILAICTLLTPFNSIAQLSDASTRGILYAGVHESFFIGDYKETLAAAGKKTNKLGLQIAYLRSLLPENYDYSPVFLGLEGGFTPLGSDDINSAVGGVFQTQHNAFWLNAKLRYFPWDNAHKVVPFLDAAIGPYWSKAVIKEYVDTDQVYEIDKLNNTSRNVELGGGVQIKYKGLTGRDRYLGISVVYQNVNQLKTIKRNSAFIDADGFSNYTPTFITPVSWQIKLEITGFHSSHL